jgi:HK97 family phage major capsid protein
MEIKSAAQDIAGAVDDLHRAFAAFRETNDSRLDQIESRLSADVLTEEKLARIDSALDETKARMDRIALERARPGMSRDDAAGQSSGSREHKAAFRAYMRSGESNGLKALEEKALSAGSGPDGGYLVPLPAEREILQRMAAVSPIRSIASVREISTASFRKAFSASGPASGWVAETDPRPQSASQQLSDLTFPAMELYAMPAATQTLLDDAAVDVEQWIADEIDTVFAEQESAAFVNGDGVNKPSGFLNYPRVDTSAWSWGSIGYVATGVAGDFAAADPSDDLVDLVYSARAG